MKTVTSKDGTKIAYEQMGSGPPLILVDGAFCRRAFGPMRGLAALLAERFTVIHYDRRGRGDSGDGSAYDVEREVEDLQALVDAAGGEAFLYGTSSGAVLAARAVAAGTNVKKLALYEPPLALDGTHHPDPADFIERIVGFIKADRRGDAVKLFMKVVGVPAVGIFFMQLMPGVFKGLKSVAHTLPYDFAVLGDTQRGAALPTELESKLRSINVPTLTLAGGKSPPWLKHAAKKVADVVKGARTDIIPGQDHNVAARAIAPTLLQFFAS
jgi:pimeloyl-ACP methyl ester carboxylesterase